MTLRILICSDAAWATSGYSNQVRQFAPALKALGHDVALLATYGLQGNRLTWEGLPVYPGGADPFGNDVIRQSALDWKADVVITLKDTFVFRPDVFQGLRWLPMVPIDHEPPPPSVIECCRHAYRPIAYAQHGFRALRKAGLDPLYAPHSYDPKVYYPMDRAAARAHLGLPVDAFVVGMVAVNRGGIPSRKAWPQNMEAFARFAASHPNAILYVHTNICTDGFEGGVNLAALAAQLGVSNRVAFCDQERYKAGFPDEYLRVFYSSIDVLNAVSLGEGFGIPQLEAQACGTPVITSGWCASEELCFAGWKVERSEALRFYDAQAAWVYIPHQEAIADRLERAYEARGAGHAQAIAGAAPYALENVVTTYWRPLLEEIEHSIAAEATRGVLRIVRPEEVLV